MSTEEPSVPAPPAPVGASPEPVRGRRTWLWWVAGIAFLATAGAIFFAFTVNIPYYEFRPGSARPTAQLVQVDGVESYPPDSDIAYTTVSLRHSTAASWLWAQFDDDIEVVEQSVVLGDRSPSENRQLNLQLMDTSKLDAIRVALVTLGYEVPISLDGVVVVQVQPGSAAEGTLEVGDTVVSIDGEPIDLVGDVDRIMDGKAPGDTVTLGIEPPDRSSVRDVEIVLGAPTEEAVEAGADPERGYIGVQLQPRNPDYEFPFEIDIDSGNVGGPSAGLAFSLGVIDVLTPGELTGGQQVAVTGTINAAGEVGPVGGVEQKAAVVVDEGYDVFLVPSSEAEQIRARTGDDVRIVPVDTLEDALDALSSLGGSGFETAAGPG